ncbi:MAG: TonB-dependent siderophore receptor [Pseudomonadota bacterium]
MYRTAGWLAACALLLAGPVLAAVDAPQPVQADADQSVEEIIVYGTQDSGLASVGRNALTASEQARSVQIFDDDLLQAFKPERLEDVLTLSSNVVFFGNNDGRETAFVVRGFQSAPILRDGFRITSFGGVTDPEIFNLDRVEVLKGPDSIVYGEANPGGIINLVTKRPVKDNFTVLSMEVGTDSQYSPRVDWNRTLGDDLGVRVVGMYETDDTFRDYENPIERRSLQPSLRWQPRDGTVITYVGEYVDEDRHADFGTAMSPEGELTAPRSQVNNHPADTFDRHFYMTGIDFEQALSDRMTVEARLRHFDAEYEYSVLWLPFTYDPATSQYTRAAASQGQDTEEWAAQLNLFGEFELGSMLNRFTLGVDYRDTDSAGGGVFGFFIQSTIDWNDPDYSEQPLSGEGLPPYGFSDTSERYGVFLQNHTNITEKLLLSLGVRYDNVETVPDGGGPTNKTDETIFQIGAKYDFNEAIGVYANFSESFTPQTSRDINQQLLEPEVGEGYEIGIKGALFNNRLTYTLAAFDITKNNVAVPDLNDPSGFASIADGEQTSEGIELDIAGQIGDRFSITAGVGFTNTENEDGEDILGAADFSGSFFASYQFTPNWSASLGLEHVGDRLVVYDFGGQPIFLDPHNIVNAAVQYDNGPWRAQVNFSNLLDEEYIDAAWGGLGRSVHPGAPNQTLLTVTYEMR